MIKFTETGEYNLSETEIKDFEIINNTPLPKDYSAFLLKHNGGKPIPNTLKSMNTPINFFLGMHNGHFDSSLYKHIETFKRRLPLSTFPIATDYFGNLLIMSLHAEVYGCIYFWDHETEPLIQDGHNTTNCSFVAYSFTELLDELE